MLPNSKTDERLPGSWNTKVRILRAIYEHGGHVRDAVRSISLQPSVAYYHRNSNQLFADCWSYVKAYARHQDDRPPWDEFWARELSDPAIEANAGVTNLERRLAKARVLVPDGEGR